jgi:hypothetical protein
MNQRLGRGPLPVLLTFGLLVLGSTSLSGCILVAGAAVGAAAVGVSTDDTIEVVVKETPERAYDAAFQELDERGTLLDRDPEQFYLEGKIEGTFYRVDILAQRGKACRVRVKARKLEKTLPDLAAAQALANSISTRTISGASRPPTP